MEAPPLPEPELTAPFTTIPLGYTAAQLRERDAYWMAKVEEARRQAMEEAAMCADHLNGWGRPQAPKLAHHIATVIRSMKEQ